MDPFLMIRRGNNPVATYYLGVEVHWLSYWEDFVFESSEEVRVYMSECHLKNKFYLFDES